MQFIHLTFQLHLGPAVQFPPSTLCPSSWPLSRALKGRKRPQYSSGSISGPNILPILFLLDLGIFNRAKVNK